MSDLGMSDLGMSDLGSIQVQVNGKEREVQHGLSVHELVESFDLNPLLIVVELNREILSRDQFKDVQVSEGDALELVHFVGGG
jgi:thiamine biosynthesis protein ThiS